MTPQHSDAAEIVAVADANVSDVTMPSPDAGVATTTDVELVLNDHKAHAVFAMAVPGDPLWLVLTTKPAQCDDYRFMEPTLVDGARVRAEIPSGPGGRFFAGHPFGAELFVGNTESNQPVSTSVPIINDRLTISAPFVTLELEPFTYKKGQHIHGKVEGGEHMLIGSASVSGSFDAEICDDPRPIKNPLPVVAPAHLVSGTIDSHAVVPKTVHAIVRASFASQDEALDVASKHRPRGSLDFVWMLVFYAKANVPCPTNHDFEGSHLFRVQAPSGGAANRPLLAAPQPASLILPKDGNDYGDIWDTTWVSFETLQFQAGDKIRGTLVSQPSHSSTERGQLAGHFEAVVCPL